MQRKTEREKGERVPATTEISMFLYLSTKISIVCLKALGSNNKVVMSWNIIPAKQICNLFSENHKLKQNPEINSHRGSKIFEIKSKEKAVPGLGK